MKAKPLPIELSAQQAAKRLGVKVETLYAYVSRGLLPRLPGPGKSSRFARADVERLAVRGRRTDDPKPPLLLVETKLTQVLPAALRYRGRDALELARTLPFEAVAQLLWGEPDAAPPPPFVATSAAVALARAVQSALPEDTLPLERLRVIGVVLGSTDPMRFELSASAVIATARSLLAGMIESLPRSGRLSGAESRAAGARAMPSLAERLWTRLSPARAQAARVHALDVALGLCADHALSPSTFAARIAASQRADPYAVVQTGFGALSGTLHGAASLLAEDLIAEVERGGDARVVIGARLQRGERIAGFGHALHPQGDPRARALFSLLAEGALGRRSLAAANAIVDVMQSRSLPPPNIDFALAAFARAAGMVRGASEAIIALARIAGFIGHALEEYAAPTRFPDRALYIGPSPV